MKYYYLGTGKEHGDVWSLHLSLLPDLFHSFWDFMTLQWSVKPFIFCYYNFYKFRKHRIMLKVYIVLVGGRVSLGLSLWLQMRRSLVRIPIWPRKLENIILFVLVFPSSPFVLVTAAADYVQENLGASTGSKPGTLLYLNLFDTVQWSTSTFWTDLLRCLEMKL